MFMKKTVTINKWNLFKKMIMIIKKNIKKITKLNLKITKY
jgi:hypothetical protein